MSYLVRPSDAQAITLAESDTVASVLQNVALIIGTKQGTVPLYREFGLPMKFLDRPMEVAKTVMAAEIDTYVPQFEPRAKIKNISSEVLDGRLSPIVEVEPNE